MIELDQITVMDVVSGPEPPKVAPEPPKIVPEQSSPIKAHHKTSVTIAEIHLEPKPVQKVQTCIPHSPVPPSNVSTSHASPYLPQLVLPDNDNKEDLMDDRCSIGFYGTKEIVRWVNNTTVVDQGASTSTAAKQK